MTVEAIASWAPSFRNFLFRFFIVGLLTSLFFGIVPTGLREADPLTFWVSLLVVFIISPLLWGFVFDDHIKWLRHRRERWVLYPDRLRLHDNDGLVTDLMLHEIARVKTTLLRGVLIIRTDGRKVVARYISRPGEMVRRINAALAEKEAEQ
ncbi:hypothetical protein FHY55_00600 [Oceanicola sp. D3]|uniref:hypothetical protein n=1 Tax=Oceanicola sp. D3 TaxID=2587163 RepID=UPI00112282C5|nr:hypothetical protein [Oceanicola sp. D3]QDC07834.1 hypothetical protein FHY55_00600 [Oceanicola sp. D3]